ncbi:type 2 lanthipeptide synthetase LanM family protein [Actinosynnema sp. NPDC047251]|uniref:Lanthionine synthetase C family protein n=1 Tax=Saccharothrix espanaensis (strain ATCC 51144 / DSM 44229 / JCM 9112 / NBRC 15066 / NRRL 15764) TaxID=1179773 RepID=K0JUA5_SACES|nr:type 2 lanthipeptide synthetase LanM family protein [Saccharothrix espanaensis]CCH31420.1 Lanthionine synthetase C family protein [Saccharothrix espanaensis DSM 44229]
MTRDEVGELDRTLEWLLGPATDRLSRRLAEVAGLGAPEARALLDAAREVLLDVVRRKVIRVLVLELNAARVTGALTADDPAGRWAQFLAHAAEESYWHGLTRHYPHLVGRLRATVENRVAAIATLAGRFAEDRPRLAALLGADAGELRKVEFGAGDSHRGGHSVTLVHCTGGTVVYKPRPMEVDQRLAGLLAVLTAGDRYPIRVPAAVVRDGYGWAGHVDHRYCATEDELAAFYTALGHWLAVMRLVSGTDLHAENIIACGPVPVVVDCESVFTPRPPHPPTGAGEATDRVAEQLNRTVLRTGLLPGRGAGLGWRGVDGSAMGGLPGEQPDIGLPDLVGAGTDTARVAIVPQQLPPTRNLPSPHPRLAHHWPRVVAGFDAMAERITRLDRAGALEPLLAGFADCVVRVIVRDTESYTELARMLWHPAGLHDQAAAEGRARALLARHSMNTRGPGDPDVHAAEVAELLVGDIPVFTTTPAEGWLHTPGGLVCGPRVDQVALALENWRTADLGLERRVTHAALVSAYLNQGAEPELGRLPAPPPDRTGLDRRRRALAAGLVRELAGEAVRGADGTATWFAPILDRSGWQTTPLTPDLYGGTLGVAVLLAGYRHEVAAGRADAVDGVAELLAGTVRTARLTQRWWAEQAEHTRRRPDPTGGYIGLGSQIWCWLALDRLGLAADDEGDPVPDALFLARQLPAAIAASEGPDLVVGTAGAIVPLLLLAERTGDDQWVDLAAHAGRALVADAVVTGGRAHWPAPNWPGGIGGFAHGATGIGWALGRLAEVTGERRFADLARGAAAYEETWYSAERGAWMDPREPDTVAAAWCHGAIGVGLATDDPEVLRRAASSALRDGIGWTHTLCHGDLGTWELLTAALAAGVAPDGLDRAGLDAMVLGSLEANGPTTGLAREVYSPSIMSGSGGIAYQLLRMHPDSDLPSVLLLGDGPAR